MMMMKCTLISSLDSYLLSNPNSQLHFQFQEARFQSGSAVKWISWGIYGLNFISKHLQISNGTTQDWLSVLLLIKSHGLQKTV
ncbi:hypothetical protein RchiOBHm_Chr6g0261511 [Rosa chinensis]|uniref:Uncharacterized protein n=1 Tax=Rosa chinensis TaxID=74649 RepID=A0A2P6PNF3_ROSCH|nr:hypothetical protein RchiOBHm_Chr6g0261511 [Rosa chinensis]